MKFSKDALLGAVVTLVAVLLAFFLTEFMASHAKLKATYRQNTFHVPSILIAPSDIDTSLIRRDSLIHVLYNALIDHSSYRERDTMRKPWKSYLKDPKFESVHRVDFFTRQYSGLTVLHLTNTGDKIIDGIQILVKYPVYYEYTDTNGKTYAGAVKGKFSVSDLALTESLDVYLWTTSVLTYDSNFLNVVYNGGKAHIESSEEVTGVIAWLIQNRYDLMPLMFLIGPVLFLVYWYLKLWLHNRRAAKLEEEIHN